MFSTQKIKNKALLTVLISLLFLLSCEMDHGLEPIQSGISGTIKYIGKWPANTGEVRLVASTKFPPTDEKELIIGDILPIGEDSTDYTFYLKPGDYYIGLVWREREATWGIQSIFSIYTNTSNTFAPGLITIPDDTTIVTGRHMIADFAYAKKASNSSISGTITFVGDWPENAENFLVIVSTKKLEELMLNLSLLDLAFSGFYPAFIDSINYFISAAPGTYQAVGVVVPLIGQPWGLENVEGLLPKEIVVPTDTSKISGIDFFVKF